ncbi:MAG: site-2 protease family protein [Candidatus Omnitrophota bacterium]
MISVILFIFLAVASFTFHEFAHGWMASRLGDPTPKNFQRLTLNPLAHIELFGTIVLPLLIILVSQGTLPPFGRAKPVPINPAYFKNPKRDMMIVAASGPLSNIAVAISLIIILKIFGLKYLGFILPVIILNFLLAIFNLLPIPPLDGSRVTAGLLPRNLYISYRKIERFGLILVFAFCVIIFKTGVFSKLVLFLFASISRIFL